MISGKKADEVRKTFGLLAGTSENAQDVLKNHTVSQASPCSCRCQDLSTEVEGMKLDNLGNFRNKSRKRKCL